MTITLKKAKLYHDNRLPYAKGTAQAILQMAGLSENAVVAELGSGTGLLTAQLLKHFKTVFAVEPNASFREISEAENSSSSTFKSIASSAQHTGLDPGSCDIAIAANAWHRFPLLETLSELSRILRKPYLLASVRYKLHFPELTEMLQPKLDTLINWKTRSDASRCVNDEMQFFNPESIKQTRLRSEHQETIDGFIGAALSGMEAPEPGDSEHEPYIEAHRYTFERLSTNNVLRFSYDTEIICGEAKVSG